MFKPRAEIGATKQKVYSPSQRLLAAAGVRFGDLRQTKTGATTSTGVGKKLTNTVLSQRASKSLTGDGKAYGTRYIKGQLKEAKNAKEASANRKKVDDALKQYAGYKTNPKTGENNRAVRAELKRRFQQIGDDQAKMLWGKDGVKYRDQKISELTRTDRGGGQQRKGVFQKNAEGKTEYVKVKASSGGRTNVARNVETQTKLAQGPKLPSSVARSRAALAREENKRTAKKEEQSKPKSNVAKVDRAAIQRAVQAVTKPKAPTTASTPAPKATPARTPAPVAPKQAPAQPAPRSAPSAPAKSVGVMKPKELKAEEKSLASKKTRTKEEGQRLNFIRNEIARRKEKGTM